MSRLGQLLRRSRGRSGLSQADVARAMGVERPSVSQWEAGLYRPSLDKLPALVSAYQLTDDERAELSSILLGDSVADGKVDGDEARELQRRLDELAAQVDALRAAVPR